ncbi:helix-turn-helix transcriptional regulator [Roseateles toxinivorans]|uniref:Transcriptional regulator n=1 Tax=Roseateles toxinivorans TaxID=270368 RepID=A0A4R6QKP9_9BURK|nr:metalloregulator ArsR/SmtB family transcription factor [Roseateles toxinivorans]TDP63802.1 transcriptional regulator [Roseateles toxinivorans]
MNNTSDQILYTLKSRGPQGAQVVAEACGLSAMGARKQLLALEGAGLVASHEEAHGVGRPARLWQLTEAGHARFPDRHGELAVQLIAQVSALLGPQALQALINQRQSDAQAAYEAGLAGAKTLAQRVQGLARKRAEEGYMARAEREGKAWLLIEDHCPICAAASSCQGFCQSELELFQNCLGDSVTVERSEHLLAGARRCVYRIRPA